MLLWTFWQDSWPAHSVREWAAFSCRVCWLLSQLCQLREEQPGSRAHGEEQQGLSSAQSLCKEESNAVFPGCSSFLGKLRCWLFPPYLCVSISLWFLTLNLRIKRGSSCKTWIRSVSKLSPLSDTDTKGSVGSGVWWHFQGGNLLPVLPRLRLLLCRGSVAVLSAALPWAWKWQLPLNGMW